jgi:spore maturation protein CgeB
MDENLPGMERIKNFSSKFSAISHYLGYPKFINEIPSILILDQAGWVMPDIISSLDKLKYKYRRIDVRHLDPENKNLTLDEYIKFHHELIKELLEFKPDCILTVNHAAFDSIGLLTKILEQFAIPTVSWFVDSPIYIFKNASPQKSEMLNIFCWERTYIKKLQDLGFKNLYYLPLGSNQDVFNTGIDREINSETFKCDIAFVGNTNIDGAKKYERIEFKEIKFQELIEKAVNTQINNSKMPMSEILSFCDDNKILDNEDNEFKITLETYCVIKATEIQRFKIVHLLVNNFNLKIFGDKHWKDIYPDNYEKPLDYYKELPGLYHNAKIIVNVTSLQMNTAVNQRCFDVFLAGGFLISDYRSDYDSLFGKDVMPTYKDEVELIEKLHFFLNNDNLRREKTKEITSIIKEKHLYEYRIKEMIEKTSTGFRNKK